MNTVVSVLLFLALARSSDAAPRNRRFLIRNRSGETLWIGTWGYTSGCSILYQPGGGGFSLSGGEYRILSVPNDWCSGRIWARTGCTEQNGVFHCQTGDCGPSINCTRTGQAPSTLLEFTLEAQPTTSIDTYDISLVDGYTLGVRVRPFYSRKYASPPPGMNPRFYCKAPICGGPHRPFRVSACPKELLSADGKSCLSVCQAVLQNNTQNTSYLQSFDRDLVCCDCGCGPNCGCDNGQNQACKYGCSPIHPTLAPFNYQWYGVCNSSQWPISSLGTSYPSIFKSICPDAYSWQFDDAASTYQCTKADYAITFFSGLSQGRTRGRRH